MGRISRLTDPTGNLSRLQQLDSDLDQIIEEFNRNQEQLDALDTSVKIIARDKVTINFDAGTRTYPLTAFNYGGGTVGTFLCFLKRSDQPDNLYLIPYYEVSTGGSLTVQMEAFANSLQDKLQFFGRVSAAHPSPPANITFYFYILRQPATVT